MKKIIKEIRLKKDTPDHRAGERFVLMSNNGIYEIDAGEDDPAVFYGGDIKNFDEWFEEFKESGWWKPKFGEKYYFVSNIGSVQLDPWGNDELDELRYSMGNCFKTKDAAERYRDYLKAIVTVRQDEGVLTPEQATKNGYVYYIRSHAVSGLGVHGFNADYISVNTLSFDTSEHAEASLDKHPNGWKTILNYDWSRE